MGSISNETTVHLTKDEAELLAKTIQKIEELTEDCNDTCDACLDTCDMFYYLYHNGYHKDEQKMSCVVDID